MANPRCIHLVVPPTASGRTIARKDCVYRCACPIPEMPALPVSITRHYGYAPPSDKSKRHVSTEDCIGCPLFVQVAK